ncbi:MAG TPA: PH domain-containing protein [Bryobacteraceae bacterium]|nr:PH domain-containing protein [Bryobacteraceae bacterium]
MLTVHPSTKLIQPFYLVAIVLGILVLLYNNSLAQPQYWMFLLPGLLLLWTILRHVRLSFTRLTIDAGKLRYESGMLSKSTRTMEIQKVQDVRVDQSVAQRLLGMGDISIETAGGTSRLTMQSVDHPQRIADQILEAAHKIA